MMTGPLIRLNHIERCYPLGKQQFFYVLRDINLEVEEGDFVSVMGPSGAGKSTLLHLLGMHDFGWTGEYYLDETAVHRLKPKERTTLRNEQIGFVFQNYNLLDDLTVYENLDIPLSYRRYGKSERSALVADTLDRFSIVGKKDLYPRQLSGGQQQLVSIARAIIAKPKLILADEPTGNLHSSQAEEIMQLFKRLNAEGTTIIQVTHSETNAAYGNRIIQLRDGWIVDSKPREIIMILESFTSGHPCRTPRPFEGQSLLSSLHPRARARHRRRDDAVHGGQRDRAARVFISASGTAGQRRIDRSKSERPEQQFRQSATSRPRRITRTSRRRSIRSR